MIFTPYRGESHIIYHWRKHLSLHELSPLASKYSRKGLHKSLIFLHDRMLMVPILCRSCAHNYRNWELKNATFTSCLDDSSPQHACLPVLWLFISSILNLGGVTQMYHFWLSIHQSFILSTLVHCETVDSIDRCEKHLLWSKLTTLLIYGV